MGITNAIVAGGTAILALVGVLGLLELEASGFSNEFIKFISEPDKLQYIGLGFIVLILFPIIRSIIRLVSDRVGYKVYGHLTVHYFGRNNSPERPYGYRLILNRDSGETFWSDTRLDKLARRAIIRSATHQDLEMNDWTNERRVPMPIDYASTSDLLDGSRSGLWARLYRFLQ